MIQSVWTDEMASTERKPLQENIEVQVAVIGAGLAGTLTAHFIRERGLKVAIFEANQAFGGMTKNTTAKITSQHNLIYDSLIQSFGLEHAREYAVLNEESIKEYQRLITTLEIPCYFEQQPAYVYTLGDTKNIMKEVESAKKLGIAAEFTTDTALPFQVKGAIKFNQQAQFHPLQFLKGISKDLTIYEQTKVEDISKDSILKVSTKEGNFQVKAKYIVIATHYPFINVPGYYFLRMHQERSYVIALRPQNQIEYGMYIGEYNSGPSFRTYQDYLLIGGSNHRTGRNPSGGCYEELIKTAQKWYPNTKIEYKWSNQDCMSIDKVPFIGRYSRSMPNVYVATGFNKWGMSNSMVSAMLITKEICENKFNKNSIYSPQRFNLSASAKTLGEEMKTAISRITLQYMSLPNKKIESIKKGQGGIVNLDGHKVGVYKNPQGQVYLVTTKCPHLGCMLAWNPDELTWDCPCHGSRFDFEGNLINNPAKQDKFCFIKEKPPK